MADTPEQQLDDMASAVADALGLLQQVVHQLPIPIKLPFPEQATPHEEFTASLDRTRTLIEDEPIPPHAVAHLDQAVLGILTAMDLIRIAINVGIDWRYDAVFMTCTTAIMNMRLARMIVDGVVE